MSDKDIELEEEFVAEEGEEAAVPSIEVTKSNLTKRRIIDNYLEERRLQRRLADYDFDL